MSVPNQHTYTIVKPAVPTPPFLQVCADDWQTAYQKLSPSGFAVYLYLAQNASGYHFEYSPTAIENTGLMKKGTATKARQELETKGYIQDGCFYVEAPEKRILQKQIEEEIKKTVGR